MNPSDPTEPPSAPGPVVSGLTLFAALRWCSWTSGVLSETGRLLLCPARSDVISDRSVYCTVYYNICSDSSQTNLILNHLGPFFRETVQPVLTHGL